ncbi:MAG: ABC transporter permease [Imperialibacter sp.]|uniref:ABC transporter permease n=1 Tax=Imperialibacter sp. TaxID=2038411 RepID=UPI0032EC98F0
MNKHNPPKLPLRFFRWFCHQDYREDIEGDLVERFERRIEEKGASKAKWLFVWDVFQLLKPTLMKPFSGVQQMYDGMFSNHWKLAFRGMKKNKAFSTLSVLGLGLGLACTVGIFLWVANELSFDRFHSKADRIFQVELILRQYEKSVVTPGPLAEALKREYPEVSNSSRYTFSSEPQAVKTGGKQINGRGAKTDATFFSMFDFPFASGNSSGFSGNSVILTQALADKLFDGDEAIGELVTVGNSDTYQVSAVLADLPQNSSFQFDFIIPFEQASNQDKGRAWGAWFCATLIELDGQATASSLLSKSNGLKTLYDKIEKPHWSSELIALTDIYFHDRMTPFFPRSGDIRYVWIFSIAGVLIFVLTCVNYISLTTSRFISQFRQAGLERILGANPWHTMHRYFVEGLLNMVFGSFVAVILLILLGSYFGIPITIVGSVMGRQEVVVFILAFIVIILLIISVVPALLINSAKPLAMIKKKGSEAPGGFSLRRPLVVFQFCVSIAMVTGTLIFQNQLTFIRDRDPGYTKENLVAVKIDDEARNNIEALKNALDQSPDITAISRSTFEYIYFDMQIGDWEGKEVEGTLTVRPMTADSEFVETFGITMAEGRFYEEGYADEQSVVINEEAADKMGLTSPIGKTVKLPRGEEGKIIGVVKNFNYWGLTKAIEPLFIFGGNSGDLYIRLTGNDNTRALAFIEESFEQINPASLFNYEFLTDRYATQHAAHARTGEVFAGFGVIALVMSCFGLLAIITFTIERKTKEIGIRKVHGAAPRHIVGLLMKDLAVYVSVAFLVAAPLTWLGMDQWLQIFSYRITLSVWQLLPGGVLVAVIAALVITYQAVAAALRNPIHALRDE